MFNSVENWVFFFMMTPLLYTIGKFYVDGLRLVWRLCRWSLARQASPPLAIRPAAAMQPVPFYGGSDDIGVFG